MKNWIIVTIICIPIFLGMFSVLYVVYLTNQVPVQNDIVWHQTGPAVELPDPQIAIDNQTVSKVNEVQLKNILIKHYLDKGLSNPFIYELWETHIEPYSLDSTTGNTIYPIDYALNYKDGYNTNSVINYASAVVYLDYNLSSMTKVIIYDSAYSDQVYCNPWINYTETVNGTTRNIPHNCVEIK